MMSYLPFCLARVKATTPAILSCTYCWLWKNETLCMTKRTTQDWTHLLMLLHTHIAACAVTQSTTKPSSSFCLRNWDLRQIHEIWLVMKQGIINDFLYWLCPCCLPPTHVTVAMQHKHKHVNINNVLKVALLFKLEFYLFLLSVPYYLGPSPALAEIRYFSQTSMNMILNESFYLNIKSLSYICKV